MQDVEQSHETLLRKAYEAFNRRDLDAALETMHPDVDWPNGLEGGRVHGRETVRDYWRRQFGIIDSRVEPQGFAAAGDSRVAVDVHQVVRDPNGELLSDGAVRHVYTIRDGLVQRMDIVEPST